MFEGKKLGFGLMRLPLTDANDKGSIDIEALQRDGGYIYGAGLYLF